MSFYPLGHPILSWRSFIFLLFVDLLVSNLLLLLICLWILGFKLIVFKSLFGIFSPPPGLLCCCYSPHLLHILRLVSETKYTNCMKTICTQSRPAKTKIPTMWSIQKSHQVSACMWLQTAILRGVFFLGFFSSNLAASQETVIAINCGISGEAPEP